MIYKKYGAFDYLQLGESNRYNFWIRQMKDESLLTEIDEINEDAISISVYPLYFTGKFYPLKNWTLRFKLFCEKTRFGCDFVVYLPSCDLEFYLVKQKSQ